MQEEFSVIDNIKMAVCSWNMGGVKPYSEIDLKDWLLPGITDPADYPELIIVGLQHIMPNKRSGMFNKNQQRLQFIQNNIMTVLNTHA